MQCGTNENEEAENGLKTPFSNVCLLNLTVKQAPQGAFSILKPVGQLFKTCSNGTFEAENG